MGEVCNSYEDVNSDLTEYVENFGAWELVQGGDKVIRHNVGLRVFKITLVVGEGLYIEEEGKGDSVEIFTVKEFECFTGINNRIKPLREEVGLNILKKINSKLSSKGYVQEKPDRKEFSQGFASGDVVDMYKKFNNKLYIVRINNFKLNLIEVDANGRTVIHNINDYI